MNLKRILFLLLIQIVCLIAEAAPIKINVNDFIVSETVDMTPLVRDLLTKNSGKNLVLEFEKGIYHFYPEYAIGKYQAVTNHDNSYKYFAFPLTNREGVTINGNGSEFIFHGVITPFLIENSKNVCINNLSIDWQQPFYLQAEVVGVDSRNGFLDFQMNSTTAEPVLDGNRLGLKTNGQYFQSLGETMLWDPMKKAVAYRAQAYISNSTLLRRAQVSQIAKNVYRLKDGFTNYPAIGMVYVFKGPHSENRMCQAFHLTNSKNVNLESINIYHTGGMGVIGEKTENIRLNKVNVMLRDGTERMVTTTADATHFCNCKGELIIENCLFENMLDDACNIHGTYIKISEIIDDYTVRAGVKHFQQYDYNFADSGDSVEFIHSKTLLPIGENLVKSFTKLNHHLFEVRFKKKLPASLKVGDAIDNTTWYPHTEFRNNIVRNNRARGILISSRKKTLIEHNKFSSMMTSILFEGDLDHWYESGSVSDVLIRDNVFYDNVYGDFIGSVIWINPHNKEHRKHHYYERNIRIEDNEFRTFDNSIVDAISIDGLVFKNNKIIETTTYTKIHAEKPQIRIRNSANAEVVNNTYVGMQPARIECDDETAATSIIDTEQVGFE